MGQTRLQIAPEVRHKVGLPSDDRAVSDENVYRDINSGLRKMAMDYDWPWLVVETTHALVSGDTEITIPANHIKTLWLAIDEYPLENVQRRRLQRFSTMTGFPSIFSLFGGNITLLPATNQDQTVAHAYIQAETVLNDDTDQVLCPDPYIDIVYTYAAAECARRLRNFNLLSTLNEEINEWKRRAADGSKLSKGTYTPNVGRFWL